MWIYETTREVAGVPLDVLCGTLYLKQIMRLRNLSPRIGEEIKSKLLARIECGRGSYAWLSCTDVLLGGGIVRLVGVA